MRIAEDELVVGATPLGRQGQLCGTRVDEFEVGVLRVDDSGIEVEVGMAGQLGGAGPSASERSDESQGGCVSCSPAQSAVEETVEESTRSSPVEGPARPLPAEGSTRSASGITV